MSAAKRIIDIVVSTVALLVLAPLLIGLALTVWLSDGQSPFYIAPRIGRAGRPFSMIKLRSMSVGAARSGVDSTSTDDPRVTAIGRFLRTYKLDELLQLVNVLKGDMSLVGPRPQVGRDVEAFTAAERELLTVRPGITDFASIVFSDEGDILLGRGDADLAYHQLIRPWKSRLGLAYVRHSSVGLDIRLLWLTATSLIARRKGLDGVSRILDRLGVDDLTRQVARRERTLTPYPPPGSTQIVTSR